MDKKAKNAAYQAEFRKRMADQGNKQVTGFVPAEMASSMRLLMQYLVDHPHTSLDQVMIRQTDTGRFERVVL